MENFTPLSASIGGALIGIAVVMLMAFLGRIAGISGIVGGVLFTGAGDKLWRLFFVAGLIAAPLLVAGVTATPIPFSLQTGLPGIVIGGLLVGFGTRLGSGCTSGHGVCGMSRLSLRSVSATLFFMAAGMFSAGLLRPLIEG